MYRVVVVLGVVGDYAKFGLLSYISRGKQPRIHQLAQYHSNNKYTNVKKTNMILKIYKYSFAKHTNTKYI